MAWMFCIFLLWASYEFLTLNRSTLLLTGLISKNLIQGLSHTTHSTYFSAGKTGFQGDTLVSPFPKSLQEELNWIALPEHENITAAKR